jgi:hypothetical protein
MLYARMYAVCMFFKSRVFFSLILPLAANVTLRTPTRAHTEARAKFQTGGVRANDGGDDDDHDDEDEDVDEDEDEEEAVEEEEKDGGDGIPRAKSTPTTRRLDAHVIFLALLILMPVSPRTRPTPGQSSARDKDVHPP